MLRKWWGKRYGKKIATIGNLHAIESVSVGKIRQVEMGDRVIEVKSLPVGYYLELIPRLENIPALVVSSIKARQKYEIGQFVMAAFDVAKDELTMIIEMASGLDRDYIIKKVSLPQMIRFIKALYEVNEFDFVLGEARAAVRNLMNKVKAGEIKQEA